MAENKTKATAASVDAFIKKQKDPERREDCAALVKIFQRATKEKPKMWGPAIVGFGVQHLVYASGREGEWPLLSFSPRTTGLVLYVNSSKYPAIAKKLGKFKQSGGCLHLKRLADVDAKALEQLLAAAVKRRKSA